MSFKIIDGNPSMISKFIRERIEITCPKCNSKNIQIDCEIIFHCKDCGITWIIP